MEHLEHQVSDLRSFLMPAGLLARSHTSTPLVMSPPRNSPHAGPSLTPRNYGGITTPSAAASPIHITTAPKRKRTRYVSIACTECKRRKIKCSGETPCGRCGHLGLTCLYSTNCCSGSLKDSEEFRQMADQVTRLQGQVNTLFNTMSTIRQETLRLAPIHQPVVPLSPRPGGVPPMAAASPTGINTPLTPSIHRLLPSIQRSSFSGPTSTTFSVDMAKTTLHSMGYAGDESDGDGSGNPDQPSPSVEPLLVPDSQQRPTDPLWEYSKEEMARLCGLYEQEVGVMYPVFRIEDVMKHADSLRSWMDTVERTGFEPSLGQPDDCMGSNSLPSLNLKIILCCALVVEQNGNSDKAIRLFDSMRPTIYNMVLNDPPDIKTISFLEVVAGYRFLCNEELLAWRTMGQVMRLCMELGLHRRDGQRKIRNLEERKSANILFWSAYVLDRRWSFSVGLPFSVSDDKIDPKLPLPDDFPYLVAMVGFSRLAAKVWSLVDYFEPTLLLEFNRSDYDNLDRQILDWYSTVPEALRVEYSDPNNIPMPPILLGPPRLTLWMRLRLNQIRIWLLTPVLHCATSINDNLDMAERVVHIAKQSIRFLTTLNEQTNLYRYSQIFYHQFLTSSIAVLFLASTHAPLQFSAGCRDEFYNALELVKHLSARSWVSQRLWRTIKSLKRYASHLGMEEPAAPTGPVGNGNNGAGGGGNSPSSQSPSSSSMAGPFSPGASRESSVSTQLNGQKLQAEVARIFEGYLRKGGEIGADHSGGLVGEKQGGGSSGSSLGKSTFTGDEAEVDGGAVPSGLMPGIEDETRPVTASVFQQMREMY
ncbi:fungal-specific transcription factor domain-containing protein [Cercophora scortea]|uniref:Fungal-specific transcription factor domain-containing protein n=1 Tax=Cercophora scortea TaxID=314031 RepID=A0AAE0MHB3_9PEZI|nr:fungal-specific transcription factor domain-containing protein [Cercophora scortea]